MKRHAGFTLVELMMVLVIMGIVMSFAFPAFRDWLVKLQIRTAAESVLRGLQLSRVEAVRQNSNVKFKFTGDAPVSGELAGAGWTITYKERDSQGGLTGNTRVLQTQSAEGTSSVYVAWFSLGGVRCSLPYAFQFNSFGRATKLDPSDADVTCPSGQELGGVAAFTSVNDVERTCTSAGPKNCLRLEISVTGQSRLCDPAPDMAGTPRGC